MSLGLLYIVIIALVIMFSNRVMSDISLARSAPLSLVVSLAVLFPVVLLVTIAISIVRLVRERASGLPGVGFKVRLVLFFTVVVVLSTVPQGILSVNFINTAMNAWFGARTGEAVRGGLSIALQYYDDKASGLARTARGGVYQNLTDDVGRSPRRVWDTVQTLFPDVAGFQVFDSSFVETFSGGDPRTGVRGSQVASMQDGFVTRTTAGDLSFLQTRTTHRTSDGAYYVVLSALLPDGFDRVAGELTDSIEVFAQLDRLGSLVVIAIVVFYVLFSLPMFLLAILVSFFIADEIIRPIVNLEQATRRVADGDYSFRILTQSHDELSHLVDSFNQMVSELDRTRKKILQTEKVAAWQEIAQRLAHEIKNPLTPIKLAAERVLRRYASGSDDFGSVLESSVRSIVTEVENLSTLLSEFRNFSRLPDPEIAAVRLKALVADVAGTYAESRDLGTKIRYDSIPEDLTVLVDAGQMKQVFANLFKNSLEAMSAGGEILVRADLVRKGNSPYCRIQIQDTGVGIAPEFHEHVFNPYFTTKTSGTGLGLSIVERIIFDHNGQIWFETEPELGTTFFIDIPA